MTRKIKKEEINETKVKETFVLTQNYEYVESFTEFMFDSIGELMRKSDPVLSKIQFVPSERIGPVKSSLEEGSLEVNPMQYGSTMEVSYSSALNSDVETLIQSIYDSSISGLESLLPQIFQTLNDICDANGQTIDAKGQSFYDSYLAMLEKIEMQFDDNGMPTTTIILPKEMEKILQETASPKDFSEKQQAIIERKRAEFFAKKRTRKLY